MKHRYQISADCLFYMYVVGADRKPINVNMWFYSLIIRGRKQMCRTSKDSTQHFFYQRSI